MASNRGKPALYVPLPRFLPGHRAIAGIMIREEGVPPDAGVEKCRKILALLVRAGFVLGPVNPSRFPCWSTPLAALAAKHISHIIFGGSPSALRRRREAGARFRRARSL